MSLLTGLTIRGRCLIAAGLSASVCAIILGQRDLLRVGCLLAAISIAAAWVMRRARTSVETSRRLDTNRATVGGAPVSVFLTIRNSGTLPVGDVMVEDLVPDIRTGGT